MELRGNGRRSREDQGSKEGEGDRGEGGGEPAMIKERELGGSRGKRRRGMRSWYLLRGSIELNLFEVSRLKMLGEHNTDL